MKKVIFFIILMCFLTSCEDVVQVDVPSERPRLAIDALIRIDENAPNFKFTIKANLTSSFFDEIQAVELDQITITNLDSNRTISLSQIGLGTGVYEESVDLNFFDQGELLLEIDYNGQKYIAKTLYVPTVPIDNLVQGTGTLFGEDDTEIIVTYTDKPVRKDFYLFDFDFTQYIVTDDEFYQGQQFSFSYFYEDGLEPGENIKVSIIGVDEDLFTYMDQIIDQSGEDFGPFAVPTATVKGNIINVTENDNFALGYFAVTQTYTKNIIIE